MSEELSRVDLTSIQVQSLCCRRIIYNTFTSSLIVLMWGFNASICINAMYLSITT